MSFWSRIARSTVTSVRSGSHSTSIAFDSRLVRRTLLALAIFLPACRTDDDGNRPGSVDKVTVTPPEVTVDAGKTVSLTAQLVDASGKAVSGSGVQWSTSDAAIATVAQNGGVTGVASGVARVIAAAGGRSGSAIVSVPPATTTQTVPANGGTVSTPGGEVKVTVPNGSVPAGTRITIEPITTAAAAGTTVPGTVYKIGVFGVVTGPRPTISVRYSTAGLPAGFDETKLTLSRKVGAFWVPLPTQVNTAEKILTATLPGGSAGFGNATALASAALEEEATVGATLFGFEVDPPSIQLIVGERRTITGRIRSLATGAATTPVNPNVSSNATGVATVSGATVSGNDIRAEVVAVSPGNAVITLSGAAAGSAGTAESFGGTVSVTVVPQASLTVNVGGLPAGVNAAITVTGPNNFSRTVTSTQSIPNVAAGNYTVTAQNVTAAGQAYVPTPASQQIAIGNGESKSVTVTYAGTLGGLTVNVAGLPAGTNAAVTVTGPNGFSSAVTQTRTLTGLAAGTYTITAVNVTASGQTYVPTPASQAVAVTAGQTATATVTYGVGTGGLTVTVAGLPANTNASITVTGPGFSRAVPNTQTLTGLTPGVYTIQADEVALSGTVYAPNAASQQVTVTAGQTATATVTYAVASGGLTITVSGLPAGASAMIVVTGPNGYTRNVPSSQTITGLAPGAYTVTASNVGAGGQTYAPSPASRSVNVVAGATATATVTYAVLGGSLTVTISGLPAGVAAAVMVTGPGGFSRAVASTETLTGLITAPYNVTASNVVSGGQTYVPTPASQIISVTVGQTSQATVTYAAPPPVVSGERSWVDACPAVVGVGTSVTLGVVARTQSGAPVPNASVTLTVSGTGNTFTSSLTTNANGRATTSFTSTVAQTKSITALITSGATSITETSALAVVATPSGARLTKISGDDQEIKVGTGGAAFVVETRTATGALEPNVPVSWVGFSNCFFTTTNADGRTSASFTFPYQTDPSGPSTITAQTSAGAAVQFTYRYIQ